MSNNITALYEALFETLQGLKDKKNPLDIDRARAINETGQTIVNAAKTEIDYLKATGQDRSAFFPKVVTAPQIEQTSTAYQTGQFQTGSGEKTIAAVPGGSITTHRMK